MKVLVTGGAGYIGSHIVDLLIEQGNEVVIVDDLSTGNRINEKAIFINCDITSNQLQEVFNKYNIDLVIHCAAKLDITESIEKPMYYYKTNVVGTINLIEQMQLNNIEKIIFSSTACLYAEGTAKETDKVEGKSPYGKSKLMCEDIIRDSRLKYVIFRYFNVAGNDKQGVMLIQRIKQGEKITINGNDYDTRDGTCIRDYIHVEDLAEAHIKAIEYLQTNDKGLFNLGTSQGYTIKEICEEAGTEYTMGSRRESDVIVSIADNTEAIKTLKWKPKRNLKDILRK
jgi:UDP-glucose 4-epimerase